MSEDGAKIRKLTEQRSDGLEREVADPVGNVHRWRVRNLEVEADSAPDVEVTLTLTADFRPAPRYDDLD